MAHVLNEPKHAHTTTYAASRLRARIAAGELLPGSKLSEQVLSDALGVSRNTLRQALSLLESEAVVTRIPNRGAFVASPKADEVREIYRVRRMIEPAAVLWSTPSAVQLDEMDEIVKRARAARDAGAVADMASTNQDFHAAIVALTGSASLQALMERVLAEMRLVFFAMTAAPDFHSPYVERNAELVTLLRAGQNESAAAAFRDYLNAAEKELLRHLGVVRHDVANTRRGVSVRKG